MCGRGVRSVGTGGSQVSTSYLYGICSTAAGPYAFRPVRGSTALAQHANGSADTAAGWRRLRRGASACASARSCLGVKRTSWAVHAAV